MSVIGRYLWSANKRLLADPLQKYVWGLLINHNGLPINYKGLQINYKSLLINHNGLPINLSENPTCARVVGQESMTKRRSEVARLSRNLWERLHQMMMMMMMMMVMMMLFFRS